MTDYTAIHGAQRRQELARPTMRLTCGVWEWRYFTRAEVEAAYGADVDDDDYVLPPGDVLHQQPFDDRRLP